LISCRKSTHNFSFSAASSKQKHYLCLTAKIGDVLEMLKYIWHFVRLALLCLAAKIGGVLEMLKYIWHFVRLALSLHLSKKYQPNINETNEKKKYSIHVCIDRSVGHDGAGSHQLS
jgi:hypothetical protein